jgi:hypothetical protein
LNAKQEKKKKKKDFLFLFHFTIQENGVVFVWFFVVNPKRKIQNQKKIRDLFLVFFFSFWFLRDCFLA